MYPFCLTLENRDFKMGNQKRENPKERELPDESDYKRELSWLLNQQGVMQKEL